MNAPVTNRQPPSGKITLIFTDIEDSTRMGNALGALHEPLRQEHNLRVRAAIADNNRSEERRVGKECRL